MQRGNRGTGSVEYSLVLGLLAVALLVSMALPSTVEKGLTGGSSDAVAEASSTPAE